jgi:hypothetical protein
MASSINASTSGAGGVITTADNTGILNLQTASTTAVTIDASQNVGIGTTSPSYKLDVQNGSARIYNSTFPALRIQNSSTGTNSNDGLLVEMSSSDALFVNYESANMIFKTADTERMRITAAGYLKASNNGSYPLGGVNAHEVASSAVDTTFFVTNSNANPYGSLMYFSGAAPNGTGNNFLQCQDTSAQRANIRSNGGLANYSGNNVNLSDQREKTNIELASSYLDKICSIPVKTFNYIDQNMEEDGGLTLGVIAQDVQAVAPELIMESNWAGKDEPEKLRLSIYQTDLQYALMKCIQEQQTIINDLKARIETLENT